MSNSLSNLSGAVEDFSSKTKETLSKGQDTIKKSGKDWLNYIEEHPLQSILFGTVIYFAIRGFFKD